MPCDPFIHSSSHKSVSKLRVLQVFTVATPTPMSEGAGLYGIAVKEREVIEIE